MCCQLHHSPVFLERREYIPFAPIRQAKSVKNLQKGENLSLFLHPDEQEGDICRGDAGNTGGLADGARAHAGQALAGLGLHGGDGIVVDIGGDFQSHHRDPLQRRRAAAHQHAEAACLAAEPHAGK